MTDGSLSERQLARRSRSTPARLRRLVGIGILRPDARGRFGQADIQRVQIVDAYERAGIELQHIAAAIAERRMSFEYTDRIYPEPSPLSGRTFADLADRPGRDGDLLSEIFVALGLPQPAPDTPLTEADERLLPEFLEAWASPPMSADAALRAARLVGDATRRAGEGWVALFMEAIGLPAEHRAEMSMDELAPRLLEPGTRVAQLLEPMTVWLLRRHMVRALNAVNIESMEVALAARGIKPRPAEDVPSIVFADMSGFTRLTEEHGDELAARHATDLARLATEAAGAHHGRLVKQLGDGVMLAFARIADGVAAAVALREAGASAGLPALHIGVSGGPVFERDGDYFGRTVNRAARISGVSGPGQILADETVAAAAPAVDATRIGSESLKGLGAPVSLFRLEPADRPRP